MAKLRLRNLVSVISVTIAMTAFATAQGPRNGTTGGSYLLVPQGRQDLSGGGATANATGVDALYWNPAGLARSDANVSAIFSRRSYIADISINYMGIGLKMGGLGSIGLTIRTFDIGVIDKTDVFNPDGTGEQFSPTIFVLGASYARSMSDRTSIGLSINVLNESFAGVEASGLTLDAGIQYASFLNIPGLSIGVTLKNFGTPMRYDGSALFYQANALGSERQTEWYKVSAAQFDMPFNMDIGANYRLDLGANSVDLGFTFENNNAAQNEYRLLVQYNLGSLASVRFANLTSVDIEDDTATTIDEGALENIFASYSFGATLNLKQLTGIGLSIDYGFIVTEFFNDNQIFALRLDL